MDYVLEFHVVTEEEAVPRPKRQITATECVGSEAVLPTMRVSA
jgi:hypothetical protein